MGTMREAISYGRFSSKKQEKGDSRNRQEYGYKTVIARYAATKGLVESTRYGFGKLFDDGKSGFHGVHLEHGGHLAAFLALVQSGDIPKGSVLVVDELSRLSRLCPDLACGLISKIVRSGIDVAVHQPDLWIDVAALSGPQFIILSALLTQFHGESATKSYHKKSMWKNKRESAKARHFCPQWLRWDDEKKDYVRIEEKVAIVKEAARLSIAGFGVAKIRNKLGLKKNAFCNLASILRNRTLLGEYQPRDLSKNTVGEPKKGYYPPVISENDFYKVQAALDSRKTPRGKRGDFVTNIFSGLIHDASDGERMLMYRVSRNGKRVLRSRLCAEEKGKKMLYYEIVEESILAFIREITIADLVPTIKDNGIDLLESNLARLQHEATELIDSPFGMGKLVAARLSKLETEIERVQTELESKKREASNEDKDRLADAKSISAMLAIATGDELLKLRLRLRDCIAALVSEIWIDVHNSTTAEIQIFKNNKKVSTIWLEGNVAGGSEIAPRGIWDLRTFHKETFCPADVA